MSEIIGRFETAYDLIAEQRGYIDAQTVGRETQALLGISLECTSDSNLIDNSTIKRVIYRHYFSDVRERHEPCGIHAELAVDSQSNINPYFARTFAEGAAPDVIYNYRVVQGDKAAQSERILGIVERALLALGLHPQ